LDWDGSLIKKFILFIYFYCFNVLISFKYLLSKSNYVLTRKRSIVPRRERARNSQELTFRANSTCLRIWLRLLFKVFLFTQKSMSIMFFLFLKNYFWDQHIKMIRKHQKHINLKQKKIQIFSKTFLKRSAKRTQK